MQTPSSPIVTVRVPATSANLGPGFDTLGLALQLYNRFTVAPAETTRIGGAGLPGDMRRDATNLFYRAFATLFGVAGVMPPRVAVLMDLGVPGSRGLGSSATAVVGGLLAANAWLGRPYSAEALLPYAVGLEHGRHPDNVSPALLGGLVVTVMDGDRPLTVRVPFPDAGRAVLYVPDFPMDTVRGRGLKPAQYPRADAVFNVSRVALLVAGLSQGRPDVLRVAMADRLHQPYRTMLFPQMPDLIEAAENAGAWGACLSGGGSAILAFADEAAAPAVAAALAAEAGSLSLTGTTHILAVDQQGATVEEARL
jgi:homoserine kinase